MGRLTAKKLSESEEDLLMELFELFKEQKEYVKQDYEESTYDRMEEALKRHGNELTLEFAAKLFLWLKAQSTLNIKMAANIGDFALHPDLLRHEIAEKHRKRHEDVRRKTARQNGGKNSRKKDENGNLAENEAREAWDRWRNGEIKYLASNKQNGYIQAMIDKHEVSRQTVFNWIKKWKSGGSTNA